jgi:hypothetical protein
MPKKKKFWDRWSKRVVIWGVIVTFITGIIVFPQRFYEAICFYLPSVHNEKFEGVVIDTANNPVPGVVVTIDLLPNLAETTSTEGGFIFKKVPGQSGGRVRVFAARRGYKRRDQYFPLPGPVRITMDKQ